MSSKTSEMTYDIAFKSIIRKCPRMVLPLINELFYDRKLLDERYVGNERVTFLDKEIPDVDTGQSVMDLRINVAGKTKRIFQIECQSTTDGKMVLRMLHYNLKNALQEASYTDTCVNINIDYSGVLYLRSNRNTPDSMMVRINAPFRFSLSYEIPVIKMSEYSLEDIIRKGLYVLLPFLFFNYEHKLRGMYDDQSVYEEMETLYASVQDRLQGLVDGKVITSYEASTLYDALKVVLEKLGDKNNAYEEVMTIMSEKILTFSADNIYNAGVEMGKKDGLEEGKKEGIKEGIKEGEKNGINLFGSLIKELSKAGRLNDVCLASEDPEYFDQLLKEFGLMSTLPDEPASDIGA